MGLPSFSVIRGLSLTSSSSPTPDRISPKLPCLPDSASSASSAPAFSSPAASFDPFGCSFFNPEDGAAELGPAEDPKADVFFAANGEEEPENPPKPEDEKGLGVDDEAAPKAEDEAGPDEDLAAKGDAEDENAPNVAWGFLAAGAGVEIVVVFAAGVSADVESTGG